LNGFGVEIAGTFIESLKKRLRLLSDNPNLGLSADHLLADIRRLTIDDYFLFYRVDRDEIEIIRILNSSRNTDAFFEDYYNDL
jgi:plasmid stabilization system protein ParE